MHEILSKFLYIEKTIVNYRTYDKDEIMHRKLLYAIKMRFPIRDLPMHLLPDQLCQLHLGTLGLY